MRMYMWGETNGSTVRGFCLSLGILASEVILIVVPFLPPDLSAPVSGMVWSGDRNAHDLSWSLSVWPVAWKGLFVEASSKGERNKQTDKRMIWKEVGGAKQQ